MHYQMESQKFARFFHLQILTTLIMKWNEMKQKGNQNKTIFSFVFCMCSHFTQMSNTFILLAYAKKSETVFCVKRHTFAMSVCVWHLCWYRNQDVPSMYFQKCRNEYRKVWNNKCAIFFAHYVICTKFPRLWPSWISNRCAYQV